MTEFQRHVAAALRNIRAGQVVSYQQLAELSGHPGAHRAVASFCKANWDSDIPCHRVIHSDGRVGKYNRDGGEKAKIQKLLVEGVNVIQGYVKNN